MPRVKGVPFYDFGGDGPIFHFAHSNGYPPSSFRRLVAPLLTHYRVVGIYHRPLWPDSDPAAFDSWQIATDDLIRFFDEQGYRNVIGAGHSLGAITTMQAAVQRPDLFRALILIEPVLLLPAVLEMIARRDRPLAAEELPLIRIALKRQRTWPDRQFAFDHFRAKQVFARWPDETLWDYVYYGLHTNGEGMAELTFPPAWEAAIYALPPTDIWQVVPQLQHPTLAVRGGESETVVPATWQLWQAAQPHATFVEIPGTSHLLTMEKPQHVAAEIRKFLRELRE
jgi:pimeloyl-ACP methyl ester carboxylesterase